VEGPGCGREKPMLRTSSISCERYKVSLVCSCTCSKCQRKEVLERKLTRLINTHTLALGSNTGHTMGDFGSHRTLCKNMNSSKSQPQSGTCRNFGILVKCTFQLTFF
jgi:hypothetical protein